MITEKCTIRTPQFRNGKIWYFHVQDGTFNYLTKTFIPDDKEHGNHVVRFGSIRQFRKLLMK